MIVLHANTIVSVILGKHTRSVLKESESRGLRFGTPLRQVEEAVHALIDKLSMPPSGATGLIDALMRGVELIPEPAFAAFEKDAQQRLHERGQSDWPILAAALAYGAGIWSNNRDFFGVGVPVWSTKNIRFASAED